MVKIKEGIVMTAREKADFERMNALPRKTWGKVDFYYKPQTKYPPRIYVFMHAEIWCDRNRRPMGLFYAHPFLSRPMNKEEIEYHHFDNRLCYHQYEDWSQLIYAEEAEADELDKESAGVGTSFLAKLKTFEKQYPVGERLAIKQPVAQEVESEDTVFIRKLIANGGDYSVAQIGQMLRDEQNGGKRLPVLILLREMYKSAAEQNPAPLDISLEYIQRKVFISQERTRRNLVRRVYSKNKLFCLEEIKIHYPDYNEEMLLKDLKRKKTKAKQKKTKQTPDLRRSQLAKLAAKLKYIEDEKEYHDVCCRIVMLQNAHNERLPIPLTVKLQNETLVYYFNWKTTEALIKDFVRMANVKGTTHEQLKKRSDEIANNNYRS